ncbi:MAG: hypothetical protein HQL08_10525, partial [Nitrospirae bacterium]|nr:hypothetical protein [Nitrospirota bacterium]
MNNSFIHQPQPTPHYPASGFFVENAGSSYAASLDDIWRKSDFVTLHVPKNKDTINLINRDSIAKMKKGVKIINCARGAIVNETDLSEA